MMALLVLLSMLGEHTFSSAKIYQTSGIIDGDVFSSRLFQPQKVDSTLMIHLNVDNNEGIIGN